MKIESIKIHSDSILTVIPSHFLPDYQEDAGKAHRDFGAKTHRESIRFIRDELLVDSMFDQSVSRPITDNLVLYRWFLPKKNCYYHAHIDLGFNHCSCGIALAHQEGWGTVIDLAESLSPKLFGGEIDFEEIRQIVKSLVLRRFNVTVTYDSFQSFDSIQQLRQGGIIADLFSVDRDMRAYISLRRGLYEKSIKCYFSEKLRNELLGLVRSGDKIDKPVNGSKDLSDAVAAAVYHCREFSNRLITEGKVV